MTWLADWSKRIKLTIDHERVDEDLTDFPVSIYLSAASGIGDVDVSAIFDELTSDDNRKKIAVTDLDGTTQLPVEIERWDNANERAWLHTKISTIVSGTDTELYIYYDSTKPDNTTYVGDVGSTPAQIVWDSHFKAVYHLGEDPTGGSECIKDSTSNLNHGTPSGMIAGDLVDGKFGKCLDFDGSDAYVNCQSGSSLDDIALKTVEAIINFDTFGEGNSGRVVQKANVNADGWSFLVQGTPDNRLYFGQDWNNGTFYSWTTQDDTLAVSTWYGIALSYDKGAAVNNPLMYIDGASVTINNPSARLGPCDSDAANDMWIGARNNSGPDREFDGRIDEVRISSVIRPAAWIKATFEGLFDNLLTFGQEEEGLLFYFSGYTFEEETPVSRILYLHNRTDGSLVATTTSSGDGYYYLGTTYSGAHYIVCLDDEAGEDYNDMILGNMFPIEIT